MKHNFFALLLIVMLALYCYAPLSHAQERTKELRMHTQDNTELTLQHYPATGKYLLIWIAAGSGLDEREQVFAADLAKQGIEVWQIDFADALYQPPDNQLLRNLDGNYVADIIRAAHQQTGKQIILASHSYGAIPVLHGAYQWQSRKQTTPYLLGAILFSPDLYARVPALGLEVEYVPVLYATSIPIFLYQDQKRNTTGQLPRVIAALRQNNVSLYVKMLPAVTGLFYKGDDAQQTMQTLQHLPKQIPAIIPLLAHTPTPLAALPYQKTLAATDNGLDSKLIPFKGNPIPPAIDLYDSNQQHYLRNNYTGKVTIVNFWTTWCPPCVEEIPSLNRLRMQMKNDNVELISINYAEHPARVHRFLQDVNVEFPVLLDTNGAVAAQWKVFVYPSTFVIDTHGKIHYGINAAIHWDSPEVIAKLRALLPVR